MMGSLIGLAAALVVALVPAGGGARPQTQAAQPQPQAKATAVPAGADLQAMGVSLDRIRRLLGEKPPTEPSAKFSSLRLEYHLEVVGKSPRVEFFKDFDIGKVTAVQYGGMTHAEFMKLTAPFWHKW